MSDHNNFNRNPSVKRGADMPELEIEEEDLTINSERRVENSDLCGPSVSGFERSDNNKRIKLWSETFENSSLSGFGSVSSAANEYLDLFGGDVSSTSSDTSPNNFVNVDSPDEASNLSLSSLTDYSSCDSETEIRKEACNFILRTRNISPENDNAVYIQSGAHTGSPTYEKCGSDTKNSMMEEGSNGNYSTETEHDTTDTSSTSTDESGSEIESSMWNKLNTVFYYVVCAISYILTATLFAFIFFSKIIARLLVALEVYEILNNV